MTQFIAGANRVGHFVAGARKHPILTEEMWKDFEHRQARHERTRYIRHGLIQPPLRLGSSLAFDVTPLEKIDGRWMRRYGPDTVISVEV